MHSPVSVTSVFYIHSLPPRSLHDSQPGEHLLWERHLLLTFYLLYSTASMSSYPFVWSYFCSPVFIDWFINIICRIKILVPDCVFSYTYLQVLIIVHFTNICACDELLKICIGWISKIRPSIFFCFLVYIWQIPSLKSLILFLLLKRYVGRLWRYYKLIFSVILNCIANNT